MVRKNVSAAVQCTKVPPPTYVRKTRSVDATADVNAAQRSCSACCVLLQDVGWFAVNGWTVTQASALISCNFN